MITAIRDEQFRATFAYRDTQDEALETKKGEKCDLWSCISLPMIIACTRKKTKTRKKKKKMKKRKKQVEVARAVWIAAHNCMRFCMGDVMYPSRFGEEGDKKRKYWRQGKKKTKQKRKERPGSGARFHAVNWSVR